MKSPARIPPTLIALTLAWVGVIIFATHLLIAAEIGRREKQFDQLTQQLGNDLKNKLDTNEAVLAGFSAFLRAVERNDIGSATRYAASATAAYPHIYMLEVARQVPVAQEAAFEKAIRAEWLPQFTLKDFPAVAHRGTLPLSEQKFTWPILFMYPSLPEAQAIYGVRLETVDSLSHTLALAKQNPKPVASPVFTMYEGGNAYILLQEVARAEDPDGRQDASIFGTTMTALMLIRTDALFPRMRNGREELALGFQASMTVAAKPENHLFRQAGPESTTLERGLLPHFQRQIAIDSPSQPTLYHFSRQLVWRDILTVELMTIFGLLVCALVTVPTLSYRHFRSLERSARELERSAYLATHDLLTGLPNRYLFIDRFEQAVQQHIRSGNAFALLLVDLDHFKEINDTLGHEVGDEVLVESAKRMTHEVRACDTVARHGGDEFVLLLANTLDADDARVVGEKLLRRISTPFDTSTGKLQITCSIGIALYPGNGTTLDSLRRAADQAMYLAKKGGRNALACADVTAS